MHEQREREVFFLSRPLPHIENSTFRYVRPRYVIHAVSSNIPFSKAKNLIHVHICMCDFFQKKNLYPSPSDGSNVSTLHREKILFLLIGQTGHFLVRSHHVLFLYHAVDAVPLRNHGKSDFIIIIINIIVRCSSQRYVSTKRNKLSTRTRYSFHLSVIHPRDRN